MGIENHPLWRGICLECVGCGCGLCLSTGMRQRPSVIKRLRPVKKPVGLATEIEGETVRVVRPGSVA
jgi:hypothetical protein